MIIAMRKVLIALLMIIMVLLVAVVIGGTNARVVVVSFPNSLALESFTD